MDRRQAYLRRQRQVAASGGTPVPPLPALTKLVQFSDLANTTTSGVSGSPTVGSKGIDGAPSMQVTANALNFGSITRAGAIPANVDPATLGTIAFYVDDSPPYYQHVNNTPSFIRSGLTYAAPVENYLLNSPKPGRWNARHISEFVNSGTPISAVGPGVASDFRTVISGGKAAVCNIDRLYANARGTPTLVMTFDDGIIGQYTDLRPILATYGFKASFAPIKNTTGTTGMSIAQLNAMYADGHDIICDGRDDDASIVTAGTLAAAMTNLNSVRQWVTDNGWLRGKDHIVWPFGVFEQSTRYDLAVGITAGSPVITLSGTGGNVTTGLVAGMAIQASTLLFPAGTTIVSVDSSTQFTVSANSLVTAGTGAGYAVRTGYTDDTNAPFYGPKVIDAAIAAGFKTGRSVSPAAPLSSSMMYSRFGLGGQELCYPAYSIAAATLLSDLKASWDLAKLRGGTMATFGHGVAPTGSGLTIPAQLLIDFFDYIAPDIASGAGQVLTVSQWHARDLASPAIPAV
ncbi:hypothetical protein BH10PSE12_BH10PSE12_02760 [soil metagenome]